MHACLVTQTQQDSWSKMEWQNGGWINTGETDLVRFLGRKMFIPTKSGILIN